MTITAIKRQVKQPHRLSIYIADHFAFGMSADGLLASKIVVGQTISRDEMNELQAQAATDKAYGLVLRHIAMRQRSEWEVQTYLKRKMVDPMVANQLVVRLKKLNLIDDLAFGRAWVANRRLLKPTSRRKLRLELQQKHLVLAVIDQLLAEDDQELDNNGNSRDDIALRELAAKKRARYPDDTKFMRYLVGQGFSYDDVRRALSDLDDV